VPSHTYSQDVRRFAAYSHTAEGRYVRTSGSRLSRRWTHRSRSARDTDRLGYLIGRSLRGGEIIALYGDLGSGKTALVRGMAAGVEAPHRDVSSPTFVLIHTYHGRLPLVHADLYRLQSILELRELGLHAYFDGHHVIAIEWAEKAGHELPSDFLKIHLSHVSRTTRLIDFDATGPQSSRLLNRVIKAHNQVRA
jgi:tRNA threonylcarbamoyladenosine biosynthesis protein TsaE